MTISGPPTAGEHEIEAFETVLGWRLPSAYRAFLLKQDGGTPEPDTIRVADDWADVRTLFGLKESAYDSLACYHVEFRAWFDSMKLLPIGRDSTCIIYCIDVEGGEVYAIDYTDAEATPHRIGENFGDFLNRIQPFPRDGSTCGRQ